MDLATPSEISLPNVVIRFIGHTSYIISKSTFRSTERTPLARRKTNTAPEHLAARMTSAVPHTVRIERSGPWLRDMKQFTCWAIRRLVSCTWHLVGCTYSTCVILWLLHTPQFQHGTACYSRGMLTWTYGTVSSDTYYKYASKIARGLISSCVDSSVPSMAATDLVETPLCWKPSAIQSRGVNGMPFLALRLANFGWANGLGTFFLTWKCFVPMGLTTVFGLVPQ